MRLGRYSVAAILAAIGASGNAAPVEPLYGLVDPMVGTGNDNQGDTVPGPALPAGSIHPSPETLTGSNAGYDAGAPISGFAQLHTQGSGGRTTYGTFLLSPQTGTPEFDEARHLSPKVDERAGADAYSVTLQRYRTRVAVTPGHYAAIYRIDYPAGSTASLVFDITRKIRGEVASDGAEVTLFPADGKIVGRVRAKTYWSPALVDIWFCAKVNRTPAAWGVFKDGARLSSLTRATSGPDQRLGAWWSFEAPRGAPVLVKMAVSFQSAERAEQLLDAEIPAWDQDAVRTAAQGAWNRELGRITLDGVGRADRARFYTALYHSMIQPRDRTLDQGEADRQTPLWDDYYTLWDSYRTAFPLMSLIRPSAYAGNVASIVHTFERFGTVATAFIAGRNYPVGQGGDEVDNVLGEALIRGVPGIDWGKAAQVALFDADERRRPRYLIQGYFAVGDRSPEPDNQRAKSGSSTLGYALNDYYASKLAAAIGRNEDAARLAARSGNWRNVWDADATSDGYTGFLLPRFSGGKFQPIDPKLGWDGKTYDNVGFYEGTSWIYSYGMLHDIPAMVAAMGGRERFIARLRHALDGGLIDITNEPSFATPWLFSEVGRPDLASYWADRVFRRFTANAYPGDEDNGAMSSHYVFNRLGLFPKLTSDLYYLHAPHQPTSMLTLEDGRTFTIVARGYRRGAIYIRGARLNGMPLDRPFLRQAEILAGGRLELELGSKPNGWGQGPAEVRP